MTTNRRKEANDDCSQNNPVVPGTIESDNHADTWYFGPNFVMDHFTGKLAVSLVSIRKFNQPKYALVQD